MCASGSNFNYSQSDNFSQKRTTSLKHSCGHVYHFHSTLVIHKYRLGLLENLATWRDNFPKNMKATTFNGECYPLLKMWNFRRRAEGFCIAHPLPAVKWWCFYESDEYFNFWGNYMTLSWAKICRSYERCDAHGQTSVCVCFSVVLSELRASVKGGGHPSFLYLQLAVSIDLCFLWCYTWW